MSIAMKDAAGDKFISYNPMPETKPYPRAKPKVRVLGKEKLKVFLEAASKNPWYLEILLGLFCGLRKGEILGLKFQDFDFEKQTVRISRQLVGNLKLKEKELYAALGWLAREGKVSMYEVDADIEVVLL